ncbi:hypothetical protein K6K13_03860 [Symbiopectobacterium purcellii]|uniref:Haemolysin-type calcium binding-related domain-containing protein n=1 Tax=Symbiopectobacterium purcellii TaxID=2871826 RepID=A0ABX9APB1_9ENTR|nr:hypothetical protein K6K13_03860 [Symbiopectobacterium purcellii]
MAQEGSPSARKYLQEALGYLRSLLNGPLQEAMNNLLDGAVKGGNASPFGPGGGLPPLDGLPDIFGPPEGPDTGDSEAAIDPIILDLDGDGIETLPLSKGVFFDHDENMFAESTGWVSPDDGLLVLDRNGDGRIDTGRELFGNHARLKDGKLADHGFLALKEQDDNGDGVLNATDASWQKLQVWRDLNSDANVDEGELFSPQQVGVTSIDTHWKASSFVDAQDHAHRQVGSITYSDGTKGQASDVWFTANKGYTKYTGDISVGEDIRRLPHIRGFGNMTELHVAMSQSPALRALVEDYVADPLAAQQPGKMDKILFSWAGVTDIDPKSRGRYIDARQLAVLEQATGKGFKHQWSGDTNPFIGSAELLKAEYRKFAQHAEACLLAQTLYRNEFALIVVDIKPDFSGLTLNFDAFESHINQLKGTDVVAHLRLRNAFHSFFSYQPTFSAEQERIGFPPQRTFIGGSENDALEGSRGDDILVGGKGDDQLNGGNGSDIYLFNREDGKDVIAEYSSESGDVDVLRFGEGITPEQVAVARRGGSTSSNYGDLELVFRSGDERVTIKDFFSASRYQIEHIEFANGTQWQSKDILNHIESGQALPASKKGRPQRSIALMKQDIAQFMSWDEEDDASASSVSLPLATAPSHKNIQQSSLAY